MSCRKLMRCHKSGGGLHVRYSKALCRIACIQVRFLLLASIQPKRCEMMRMCEEIQQLEEEFQEKLVSRTSHKLEIVLCI